MFVVDNTDASVIPLAYESGPVVSLREEELPSWLDFEAIRIDLADDGVSAPEPYVEDLQTVVEEAGDRGLDLKVIYTEEPAAIYTDARDVATLLNQEYEGTIFVRTPVFTGSSSDTLPRHLLEAGQDDASDEHEPAASAAVFVHKVTSPTPPWGALAAVTLVLVVVAALAFAVVLFRRRR